MAGRVLFWVLAEAGDESACARAERRVASLRHDCPSASLPRLVPVSLAAGLHIRLETTVDQSEYAAHLRALDDRAAA